MPDDKSDQDVTENDDDEDDDLKVEISNLSCQLLKVDGNTDEDVRGYDEISVNENDDQLDFVVDEDTDDEVQRDQS